MAIAVDTVSGSIVKTAGTSPTSTTATHVVGASATFAVLFIEGSLEGGQNDSGITWTTLSLGSSNFTLVSSSRSHSGGGTTGFVELYYIQNPPTGSQTLTVAMSGGTGAVQDYQAFSVSYTGTFAASPLGTAQITNGAFVSSLTISDTLASGDLFVGCCCNGSSAPTVTTGTSDATSTGGTATASHGGLRVAHNSGTGSVSLVFGTNSVDNSSATGVNLIASTGAAVDYSGPPALAADPQGWMFTQNLQADTIPAYPQPWSVDAPVSSADVSLVGYLPVGAFAVGDVTADRNIVGLLPAGILPYGPVSHDTSVAGIVHLGAPQVGPASHDTSLAGVLYSGPFVLTSGGFDYITTGVLYATAVPVGTATHTANVTGILPVGVTAYGPISHTANVAGLVPVSVIPYGPVTTDRTVAGILHAAAFALNGPSFDYNTVGVLYAGAFSPTTITASRTIAGILHAGPFSPSTVTASRNVVGVVELGPGIAATVTRSTTIPGLLVVGVHPTSTLGPIAPLSPVTDTLYQVKAWTAVTLASGATLWLRGDNTMTVPNATATLWARSTGSKVIE